MPVHTEAMKGTRPSHDGEWTRTSLRAGLALPAYGRAQRGIELRGQA